jgi:hypothetical protein
VSHPTVPRLEYEAGAHRSRLHALRLVVGLLCLSIPLSLAFLSVLMWMKNSPAVFGVMLLGFYVGLPAVIVGLPVLPGGTRVRTLKLALLPLLVAFAIIFSLGLSAQID